MALSLVRQETGGLSHLLLLLLTAAGLVTGQKRINLADPTVCPQTDKTHNTKISLSDKYLVVFLDGAEEQPLPRNCAINVQAPKGDDGLMVYLEDSYLRQGGEGGCVDHVQFGEDDIIPFITLKKSQRLCGQVSQFDFLVDSGALLIWLNLNRNRPKKHRETFPVVHLNFTVTPFRKKNKNRRGYEECGRDNIFLPNRYFCDGAVNCATSKGKYAQWDESRERCNPTTTRAPPTTTPPPEPPTIQTEYDNIGFESEDLRLGTIISVSLGVLVGLACCMVCCVRKCSRVPSPATPTTDDECQEMRGSGSEDVGSGRSSQSNHRLSGLPIPRRTLDPGGGGGSGGYRAPVNPPRARTPPPPPSPPPPLAPEDVPPPSYSEIFPQDYEYNKDRSETSSAV